MVGGGGHDTLATTPLGVPPVSRLSPLDAGGKESLSLALNQKMLVLCELEETPISSA
jgi:hypothetical protein